MCLVNVMQSMLRTCTHATEHGAAKLLDGCQSGKVKRHMRSVSHVTARGGGGDKVLSVPKQYHLWKVAKSEDGDNSKHAIERPGSKRKIRTSIKCHTTTRRKKTVCPFQLSSQYE